MKIHPREVAVKAAELDIKRAIEEAVKKHGLTSGEELHAVNAAASGWIAGIAKYAIREERHPGEPDRPGGLA
jgi:hypothetical protein